MFGDCSVRSQEQKEEFIGEWDMANSKYEYVKSFEVEDEVMPPNLIVVRIDGRGFRRWGAELLFWSLSIWESKEIEMLEKGMFSNIIAVFWGKKN